MGASSILSKFQQSHVPTSSVASPLSSPSQSPSFYLSEVIRVASPQLNNVHHQKPQVQSSVEDNQWTFTKNYTINMKKKETDAT